MYPVNDNILENGQQATFRPTATQTFPISVPGGYTQTIDETSEPSPLTAL